MLPSKCSIPNLLPLQKPAFSYDISPIIYPDMNPPSSGHEYPIFPSILVFLISALLITLAKWTKAWRSPLPCLGPTPIPGVAGLPFLGSLLSLSRLPHRTLSSLSQLHSFSGGLSLLAFSLGPNPVVVSSDPATARELLSHPLLSDRPLPPSASRLLFSRAIGFAPAGPYWRLLRRLASSHLFSPHALAARSPARAADTSCLLRRVADEQSLHGTVCLRPHLQFTALNNVAALAFGRHYDLSRPRDAVEAHELRSLVREGFELLGAFGFADHAPAWLSFLHTRKAAANCHKLVPRVRAFFSGIIKERRRRRFDVDERVGGCGDFVDVLLSLHGDERLSEDDMISVLWEMVFRGTDTTALLTEWVIAELVLNPRIQRKLQHEIDEAVLPGQEATDDDLARMPYLQAVIKETLRIHPPGPLLSWARLATGDVHLSNGMVVPVGTTAMVNMWAIARDESLWDRPSVFRPERFLAKEGGVEIDVRGGDLRLAPFGSGRRVCPGRNLSLVTVGLWVARLVQCFEWAQTQASPVSLEEELRLSLEMKNRLVAIATPRNGFAIFPN